MSLRREDYFGVSVALLGAVVTIGAMLMLAYKVLDSIALATLLTMSGLGMVALGMYVVIPGAAKAAIHDLSVAAERMKPLYGRRAGDTEPQPTTITPSPGQPVVVDRPDADNVLVPASGDPVSIDGKGADELPAEEEAPNPLPTTTAIGLVDGGAGRRKRGTTTPTRRGLLHQTASLYPPTEA